jgi:hypothetical protein
MGTRSTFRVIEKYTDEKTNKTRLINLVLLYVQLDGYPDGHPLDTARWLASGSVVNGINASKERPIIFNGAGCLAAQLVARYKDGAGGSYIYSMNSRGKCWDEYTYDIIVDENKMEIEFVAYTVGGNKKPTFIELFRGKPEDYVKQFEKKEKVNNINLN